MSETITVYLTVTATPAAPRLELVIPKDVSASELRKSVADKTKIPLAKLRLITRGKLIGDKSSVEEFKLQDGHVLHCMGKPEGASAAVPEASAPSPGTIAGSSVTIQPQTTASTPAAVSSSNPLQTAFATMKSSNPPQTYITAVTTLEKVLSNITSNPMEEKYRKVKKMNAAFQKRLGGVAGGDDAMKAAGFVTEMDNAEEVYIMHASAEQWPQLMAAKATVEAAVREAKAAASAPPPNAAAAGMLNFGAMSGMGTGMNPGMMGPDMQSAAAQMMQNPAMLQNMLQNPMVQNMIRNDPRFANNPMARQSMEALMSNPAMVNQIAQMMRDPNMQQQMQGMMAGAAGGTGGMPPAGFGGMPPFGGANVGAGNSGAAQQQGATAAGGSGGNDQDQTEEEMIAEAIRRSLEEGGS